MIMAVNITQATSASIADFMTAVEPEQKRKDSFALLDMI